VSSNVAGGLGGGVLDGTAAGITALFDNFHGNTPTAYEGPLGGFVARPTLLGVDPAYRDLADPRPHRWDLHLDSGSGLIDRGDWTLTDPDGSRSDVGAYGGVHAARWDRDGDGAFGRWSPGPYDGVTDLAAGLDPDDGDPLLSPSSDRDGDGFTPATGDCDDGDPEIHPGAPERCNGRDDDCDGDLGDEAVDADGDGLSVCDGDCDDDDQDRSPAHEEECNGTDDDCDGELGAGEQDEDGDGFRVCAGDCDDGDPLVHPWALERCNGQDDDCDGEVDEGVCLPEGGAGGSAGAAGNLGGSGGSVSAGGSSAAGAAGAAAGAGSSGAAGNPNPSTGGSSAGWEGDTSDPSACGCRTAGSSGSSRLALLLAAFLGLTLLRRRRGARS